MSGYATVVLDDEVVALETLRLATFSDGFFFGCGLFETLALTDDGPQLLGRHLARLRRGLVALPVLPRPRDELLEEAAVRALLERGARQAAQRAGRRPDVVKITCADGHVLMTFRDAPPDRALRQREGLAVDFVDAGSYRAGDRYANHKTISYLRSYSHLRAPLLFANERNEICESPTANVFLRFEDRIVTPPIASPCLPGIIREVLLEARSLDGVPIVEEAVPADRLTRAHAAFLSSSLSIAVPIPQLLGRALPASSELAAAARALVAGCSR